MDTYKKRQIRTSIGTLLRWLALSLLFAGTHAFAQTGGTVTYVYTDPQGTPLAETDASGNITATFEYAPYGTYAPQGTSTPGATPKGPGYTGHVNDPETNLVYMQARYYDPLTGHFLSTDPVRPRAGDAFNFNRYAYVNNNPIMGLDPTGMEEECGPGCMMMRRLSDYFSGVGRAILGGSSGMPTSTQGPLGQGQVAVTYMNGAANEDLASASAAVAPLADAVPGMTLVGCADGEHCSGGDLILGGLAVLPGEGIETAEGTPLLADAVHGNSLLSTRTAYLYRLTTRDGDFLKWGISYNPAKRYPWSFMFNKKMQIMMSGTRREMLNLERWIVERDPGKLNRERWAGDAITNGTVENGP